jgi:hypothetical protein
MNKKTLVWLISISLVLTLLIVGCPFVYVVFFFRDTSEFPYSSWQPEKGVFLIDSKTILDLLSKGETNVFTPSAKQGSDFSAIISDGVMNWSQRDFLMIADAVNQKVWGDSLNDWKLYRMDFSTDCHINPNGFEEGRIVFFKADVNKINKYVIREFLIKPKYGYVEWGGGARASRPLFGWKSVNTNRFISADDALKIAEVNGGKDTRIRSSNNCGILLDLVPETSEEWSIDYLVDGLPEFGITINPSSGEIIKKWHPDGD